ncbi:MAG: hypothetical protein K0R25_400 [Rickettsiaceae bacterium]|jgi:hypothetical protein|nr:hypothetical protein [Rickettsiaceae bacterium]
MPAKSISNTLPLEITFSRQIYKFSKEHKPDTEITIEKLKQSIGAYVKDKGQNFDREEIQKISDLCSDFLLNNKDLTKNEDEKFTVYSYALYCKALSLYELARNFDENDKISGKKSQDYADLINEAWSYLLQAFELSHKEPLLMEAFNNIKNEKELHLAAFELEVSHEIRETKFLPGPPSELDKVIYEDKKERDQVNIIGKILKLSRERSMQIFLPGKYKVRDLCSHYINSRMEGEKVKNGLTLAEIKALAHALHIDGSLDYYDAYQGLKCSEDPEVVLSMIPEVKESFKSAEKKIALSCSLFPSPIVSRNAKTAKRTRAIFEGEPREVVNVQEEKDGGRDDLRLPESESKDGDEEALVQVPAVDQAQSGLANSLDSNMQRIKRLEEELIAKQKELAEQNSKERGILQAHGEILDGREIKMQQIERESMRALKEISKKAGEINEQQEKSNEKEEKAEAILKEAQKKSDEQKKKAEAILKEAQKQRAEATQKQMKSAGEQEKLETQKAEMDEQRKKSEQEIATRKAQAEEEEQRAKAMTKEVAMQKTEVAQKQMESVVKSEEMKKQRAKMDKEREEAEKEIAEQRAEASEKRKAAEAMMKEAEELKAEVTIKKAASNAGNTVWQNHLGELQEGLVADQQDLDEDRSRVEEGAMRVRVATQQVVAVIAEQLAKQRQFVRRAMSEQMIRQGVIPEIYHVTPPDMSDKTTEVAKSKESSEQKTEAEQEQSPEKDAMPSSSTQPTEAVRMESNEEVQSRE